MDEVAGRSFRRQLATEHTLLAWDVNPQMFSKSQCLVQDEISNTKKRRKRRAIIFFTLLELEVTGRLELDKA
jgi:hypothetical protein